ncbi:MAG: phosphate acyltransferase PlsX [Gammaproteobacteria bacterium]|nr:phosphate acyltransferase PlsX [Gammaproteobacteria bacterium]
MSQITVALDAMGGDHGPSVVIPAALDAINQNRELRLILVGDRDTLAAGMDNQGVKENPHLQIHHASQKVEMDDAPALVLRTKKDSSMRVAINLVKDGEAHACVSAGNTGALMATARFVLKTLPGIDRPAIISALPTMTGHTYMLDLGANIQATADQLVQFAVMGSVLVNAVDNNPQPAVGLLNIGEEAIKGNEGIKEAARILGETAINYVGFVEGDDIYAGKVDVVVCDGFVGNVALKSSEGVAHMITHFLKLEFSRNLLTRLSGVVALPVLKALHRRVDPRRHNGATLLGLKGIVVKSHGGADSFAFTHAIMEAVKEISKDVPKTISEHLDTHLNGHAVV